MTRDRVAACCVGIYPVINIQAYPLCAFKEYRRSFLVRVEKVHRDIRYIRPQCFSMLNILIVDIFFIKHRTVPKCFYKCLVKAKCLVQFFPKNIWLCNINHANTVPIHFVSVYWGYASLCAPCSEFPLVFCERNIHLNMVWHNDVSSVAYF